MASSASRSAQRSALALLVYTLPVILFGALVRATLSGNGCGDHWPTCHGAMFPEGDSLHTLIEYTHRVTSGVAWLWSAVLFQQIRRAFPAGHPARRGGAGVLFFMSTEALVGAGLVLFQMVAANPSEARAIWVSVHLGNTFLLLAAMALTVRWSRGAAPVRFRASEPAHRLIALCLLGTLGVSILGAVIALGDSLLPGGYVDETHLFVRLRLWHPGIAIAVSGLVLFTVFSISFASDPRSRLRRTAQGVAGLFVSQLGLGAVSVWLDAPIPLQLAHLLLADLIWIALVAFAAQVGAVPNTAVSPAVR